MADPVFFAPPRPIPVSEIARLTGARLVDESHGSVVIDGIAPAASGGAGKLVFVEGKRNAGLLDGLVASAVLCTEDVSARAPSGLAVLVTPRPQWAFALVGRLLYPAAARPQPLTGEIGISPRAVVSDEARLEPGVVVEAGAVIGPDVAIGAGSVVAANAVVGRSTQIGRDCFVGPCATVQYALIGNRVFIHGGAQIGREGFGFVIGPRGAERLPQIGRVVVQDDVEIGANATIDRGAMADTVIGEGTKIDNLVQIAHNVEIGRHCLVAGNVGVSGSARIGDGVLLGGGVGVADHTTIGAGAQLAGGSGLMHDVPAGERWGGYPAMPFRQWFRQTAALRRLVAPKGSKGQEDGD
jgi:UDP-3-O-[3-hydroxymyristoyl] glucosamine N-acyltransferase